MKRRPAIICACFGLGLFVACVPATYDVRPHQVPEGYTRIETSAGGFAYVEVGEGPLVLLFHGFPDTPQTWDAVRPALAEAGYRAVSPWLMGYGPSDIPEGIDAYKPAAYGEGVAALITALGEESAYVVGHDWGASIAYAGALLHPERVRKLVSVAIPHPGRLDPDVFFPWRARHFWRLQDEAAEDLIRANDFAYVDEIVARWSPLWDIPAGETEAVKNVYADAASLTGALAYYRALDLSIGGETDPPFDGNIQVPTLAFAGESDTVAGPSDFEAAADGFDASYDIHPLPGGHFPHREDPDLFIDALLTFLAE